MLYFASPWVRHCLWNHTDLIEPPWQMVHTNQLQQVKPPYLYLIWKIIRTIVKLVIATNRNRKLYGIKLLFQKLAKSKIHNCTHSVTDEAQAMPRSVQSPSCRAMGTYPLLGLVPSEMIWDHSYADRDCCCLHTPQCWTGQGTSPHRPVMAQQLPPRVHLHFLQIICRFDVTPTISHYHSYNSQLPARIIFFQLLNIHSDLPTVSSAYPLEEKLLMEFSRIRQEANPKRNESSAFMYCFDSHFWVNICRASDWHIQAPKSPVYQ